MADTLANIADYFRLIHTQLIWPTVGGKSAGGTKGKTVPKLRPDRLVLFQRELMKTHSKAVAVFAARLRRCTTNDDCEQDEECKDGFCVPPPPDGSSAVAADAQTCTTNGDCEQDEECIGGFCTPPPFPVGWAPVNDVPTYGDALQVVLEAYYGKIYRILVGGMARNPGKLAAVRTVLMEMYAGMAKASAVKLPTCDENDDCEEGFACVNGVCVPIPFRLVFRAPGEPIPWM
jgi:hypothetical protein